jgi:hypothetical protein
MPRRCRLLKTADAFMMSFHASDAYWGRCSDCGTATMPCRMVSLFNLLNRLPWNPYRPDPGLRCSGSHWWCGHDGRHEFYMVHDTVWEAAGAGQRVLCVGCLETRLGRELTPADFSDCWANEPSWWDTPRLAARKGQD